MEIGKIIGLGVAGFGVYWIGSQFGWWGAAAQPPVASAGPGGATAPPGATTGSGSPGPAQSSGSSTPPPPTKAPALTADQQASLIAALNAAGQTCSSVPDCPQPTILPLTPGMAMWNGQVVPISQAIMQAAACTATKQQCSTPNYNASQWNWFMQNKTNPGSTAAQLTTGDTLLDAPGYVAARVAAGYGLGDYRGLGRRINYVRKVRRAA